MMQNKGYHCDLRKKCMVLQDNHRKEVKIYTLIKIGY